LLGLALVCAGCDEEPPEEVGGDCESYGTPCFCPDGQESCQPHSTDVCDCPDQPAPEPEALPGDEAADDETGSDEATGDQSAGSDGPGFDPAPYAACSSDDECVALRQACFTAAVHRDKREEYEEVIRGTRFRCEPPAGGRWPEISAVCRDGTCAVVVASD